MILTRDINDKGMICFWYARFENDLFLNSTDGGDWITDEGDQPFLELTSDEFKEIFENDPPEIGSNRKISKLTIV